MVEIKGLEKFAPKDFPGFIASTVFLAGCNFRCPYCHNADLVLRPRDAGRRFPSTFSWPISTPGTAGSRGSASRAASRSSPDDLEDLLRRHQGAGPLVKLDTNGSLPDRLASSSGPRLVDRWPWTSRRRSSATREVTRSKVDPEDIVRSRRHRPRTPGCRASSGRRSCPGWSGERGRPRDRPDAGRGAALPDPAVFPGETRSTEYRKVKPYRRDEVRSMAACLPGPISARSGSRESETVELKVKRLAPDAKLPVLRASAATPASIFSPPRTTSSPPARSRPFPPDQVAIPEGLRRARLGQERHLAQGRPSAGRRRRRRLPGRSPGRHDQPRAGAYAIKTGMKIAQMLIQPVLAVESSRPTISTTPRAARAASDRPAGSDASRPQESSLTSSRKSIEIAVPGLWRFIRISRPAYSRILAPSQRDKRRGRSRRELSRRAGKRSGSWPDPCGQGRRSESPGP